MIANDMENISIRKATIKDLEPLQDISRQTFSDAFAPANSGENMEKYMGEAFSIERLRTELNDPNAEFYFAILDNNIIAYLKLNFGPSQTELQDGKGIEIERIYVLQEFIGNKVGQMLYEKTKQIAKQKNADYIWLGVWEENQKAINFYKKNGFVAFDRHNFMLGNDKQTDIMMKLQLKEE
jgi:diamine N-acetyltransferase